MIEARAFEVRRDDLRATRVATETIDPAALAREGKAVLAIDRFALTANNITYAAYGDQMSYWAFFPASDGCGRIPVWGYADVLAPGLPDLPAGTRVYGYLPMATHFVVTPARTTARRFVDGAAHRQSLPPVYNVYERVIASDPSSEDAQMTLRPLLMTSFLIADFLQDNGHFGAKQIVISSASSKTSIGLGLSLLALAKGTPTIGLTSPRHIDFVTRTHAFDRVASYDAIASVDASVPTVFVDMAGSADILSRVHGHFADRLVHSCRVGATHWEDKAGRMELPGARPVFFFAPAQIQKRTADWGPTGIEERFAAVWRSIVTASHGWLTYVHHRGAMAVEQAYRATLDGKAAPESALILSL
jgi:hypothetical protein